LGKGFELGAHNPHAAPRRAQPAGLAMVGAVEPGLAIMGLFFAGPIHLQRSISPLYKALTGAGALSSEMGRAWPITSSCSPTPCFVHSLELTLIFVVGSAIIGQNTLGFLIALLERGKNSVVTEQL